MIAFNSYQMGEKLFLHSPQENSGAGVITVVWPMGVSDFR